MKGYRGSCGSDNSEIHDPILVVLEQPGTVAIEQNVTSDESKFGSISTEMHSHSGQDNTIL